MPEIARIIASFGRSYLLDCQDQKRRVASVRGKKTHLVCGDQVVIELINEEQAVIERAQPRQTLLCRSDAWRSKLIAANITQVIVVIASVPRWHDELLGRCLIAAQAAGARSVICINKCDLSQEAGAQSDLNYYSQLGYKQVQISASHGDISPLSACLQDHVSVLLGQSGVGKSTIINTLIPDVKARVGEISRALHSGKHTTTHATLYTINKTSDLIDTPGLQSFGLKHIPGAALSGFFREFTSYLGRCRFHDCQHRAEPDCVIQAAIRAGEICLSRLELFHRLQDECMTGGKY